MKYLLTIALLFIFTLYSIAQTLNSYGHIEQEKLNYTILESAPNQLIFEGNILQGNNLYTTPLHYITLENTCGNTPPVLRIYDKAAMLLFAEEYTQVINLQSNSTGSHLYFLDRGRWQVLNTTTYQSITIDSHYPIVVDKDGIPIYYKNRKIHYSEQQYAITIPPKSIQIDNQGDVYVFARNNYWIIDENNANQHNYQSGYFFESTIINNQLYWVEKEKEHSHFIFTLYQVEQQTPIQLSQTTYPYMANRKSTRNTTDGIFCPFYPEEDSYPVRIGNSYAEHQNYGGSAYLHPGVDLLGDIGQDVYAVSGGVIKAILTIGGDAYWRIATGDSDTDGEQGGYLYAHVAQNSIPFTEGDMIEMGDYLGEIVEWFGYDFHHLHFARLKDQGDIWTGSWWTDGNVLTEMVNFEDNSAPVFEPLWQGNTVAFRAKEAPYDILAPDCLTGEFDMICHIYDYSNTDWRLDVHSLRYELWENLADPAPIFEADAFNYHFLLDTYFDDEVDNYTLETIYSTDNNWSTLGNYDTRNFYQQISRSNGEGMINPDIYFDSNAFDDGDYVLRVYAKDAKGNESYTDQAITFCNNPLSTQHIDNKNNLSISPNPSSGSFQFNWPKGAKECLIYDVLGRTVEIESTIQDNQMLVYLSNKGTYIVSIIFEDGQTISDFIVVE